MWSHGVDQHGDFLERDDSSPKGIFLCIAMSLEQRRWRVSMTDQAFVLTQITVASLRQWTTAIRAASSQLFFGFTFHSQCP
jgi:hypothetical protein